MKIYLITILIAAITAILVVRICNISIVFLSRDGHICISSLDKEYISNNKCIRIDISKIEEIVVIEECSSK